MIKKFKKKKQRTSNPELTVPSPEICSASRTTTARTFTSTSWSIPFPAPARWHFHPNTNTTNPPANKSHQLSLEVTKRSVFCNLRSIHGSNCIFSISRVFIFNKSKARRVPGNPDVLQGTILWEWCFQVTSSCIVAQISNINFAFKIPLTMARHSARNKLKFCDNNFYEINIKSSRAPSWLVCIFKASFIHRWKSRLLQW